MSSLPLILSIIVIAVYVSFRIWGRMKTKMALAHNDVALARSWRRAQHIVGLICATVLFTVAVIDEWGFPALFLLFLVADLFLSQVIDPDLLIRTKIAREKQIGDNTNSVSSR